jgi:hypothetical protein
VVAAARGQRVVALVGDLLVEQRHAIASSMNRRTLRGYARAVVICASSSARLIAVMTPSCIGRRLFSCAAPRAAAR